MKKTNSYTGLKEGHKNTILLFTGIIIVSVAQLFLKRGVITTNPTFSTNMLIETVKNPYLISGLGLYGLGSILWLFILDRLPLSIAYPSMSVSYVIVFFASGILFTETLSMIKIVGVTLIFFGVATINKRGKVNEKT